MPLQATRVELISPAKINLVLKVLDRRSDGYHNLLSWMYPIALADRLTIETKSTSGIELALDSQSPISVDCHDGNLISRAYWAFEAASRQKLPGLKVSLFKRIPTQAGLGGGSSNAATLLRFLNQNSENALSEEALIALAMNLGADVPFFLSGQPALAKGIGEKLFPLPVLPPWPLLLLKPRDHGISTSHLFQALSHGREENVSEALNFSEVEQVWEARLCSTHTSSASALDLCLENDFLPYAQAALPCLSEGISVFESLGLSPMLTGTGPTLFAFLGDKNPQSVLSELRSRLPEELWLLEISHLTSV